MQLLRLKKTLKALSEQSIAKAQATASTPPTQKLIEEKVRGAAEIIEAEGPNAFNKFRGDSDFIFGGTYVWIHDLDGVMHVHPIQYKMENQNLINLRGAKGKLIFVEMNSEVQKNPDGEAWVGYWWPKPGDKEPSLKASFVKKAVYQGKTYVVGCGVYDMDISQIVK